MYSIKTNGSYNPASRSKILKKNFFASSESSKDNLLHFSYRLVDLQKEIEKRTFYLGKNRSAEGAQHLLDLIGMSRDEGDVLYPFAKAAMADVYDTLNVSTAHIPKRYEWKQPTNPIIITPFPTFAGAVISMDRSRISDDKKKIILLSEMTDGGLLPSGAVDTSKYTLKVKIELKCTVQYNIIGVSNSNVEYEKTFKAEIPAEYIRSTNPTKKEWLVGPYELPIELASQSSITSSELIKSIDSLSLVSEELQLIEPIQLHVGDILDVSGVYYEVTQDTNENTLDLAAHAVLVDSSETLVEGVHYYLAVPNFINLTSIEPLDNAIMEALVNRIIWKWLVLSYPAEAATYDQLYQDTLKSIVTRCNIFNKHWRQVPRIL